MPSKNNKVDGLQRYIDQVDFDLAYPPRDAKELERHIDEITVFIEYTYGQDVKNAFVSLIDYQIHYEMLLRKLRAFLFSLNNSEFLMNVRKESYKENGLGSGTSNSVFIVHGHDEESKVAVARFVEKLGLEPIILHERPNNGKTVIEKLESNAEKISFAVVLLTPDDKVVSSESDSYKYRARQNVIYELGYFNAKLGRSHVCVLKKGDVEVLSDYLGVVYVDMDKNGAWRNQLAREIKEAGLLVSSENLEKALLS